MSGHHGSKLAAEAAEAAHPDESQEKADNVPDQGSDPDQARAVNANPKAKQYRELPADPVFQATDGEQFGAVVLLALALPETKTHEPAAVAVQVATVLTQLSLEGDLALNRYAGAGTKRLKQSRPDGDDASAGEKKEHVRFEPEVDGSFPDI